METTTSLCNLCLPYGEEFFHMFNCNFLYFNACLLSLVLSMSTVEKFCLCIWNFYTWVGRILLSLCQAEQSQLSLPFLAGQVLQELHHLHAPLTNSVLSPGPCVSLCTEESRTRPNNSNMVPVGSFMLFFAYLILCCWCGYSSNIFLKYKLNDLILYVCGVYSLLSKFWTHCWEKYDHNASFFFCTLGAIWDLVYLLASKCYTLLFCLWSARSHYSWTYFRWFFIYVAFFLFFTPKPVFTKLCVCK